MEINILFEDRRYLTTVQDSDTIKDIKASFSKRFGLNMKSSSEKFEEVELVALYARAVLNDSLIVVDVVVPGSTLRLKQRKKPRIYLRVVAPFPMESLELTDVIDFGDMTVADLRSVIQERTGIPVSVFRLLTQQDVQMHDNYALGTYGLYEGESVRMHVWDGCTELLQASRMGDVTATMKNVVSFSIDPVLNRYHLRVALYLAARYGHTQLALQLLKAGARSEEAIGEHPCRDWVSKTRHPETHNTAVHVAAQLGKIAVLKILIYHNVAGLIARNADGLTPANIARRNKQTVCFKFLVMEQLKGRKIEGLTLNQYAKVRQWLAKARDRLSYYRYDSDKLLLLGRFAVNKLGPVVGSMIQVDGFGHNIQSSASVLDRNKMERKSQWLWLKERLDKINNYIEYETPRSIENTDCKITPVLDQRPSEVSMVTSDYSEPTASSKEGHHQTTGSQDGIFITQPIDEEHQILHRNVDHKCLSRNRTTVSENSSSDQLPCNSDVLSHMLSRRMSGLFRAKEDDELYRAPTDVDSASVKQPVSYPGTAASDRPHSTHGKAMIANGALEYKTKSNSDSNILVKKNSIKYSRYLCQADLTEDLVGRVTGLSSHEFAKKSLDIGTSFKTISWLKQLRIAMNFNKNTIKRGLNDSESRL